MTSQAANMDASPIWSRNEPERQGPFRDGWSNTSHLRETSESAATTVEQAVNLGYQVIEDNIERGKALARHRRRSENDDHDDRGDDLLDITAQFIKLGREFSYAYFDLIERTLLGVSNEASGSRGSRRRRRARRR